MKTHPFWKIQIEAIARIKKNPIQERKQCEMCNEAILHGNQLYRGHD
jgi:hypothetical protein